MLVRRITVLEVRKLLHRQALVVEVLLSILGENQWHKLLILTFRR